VCVPSLHEGWLSLGNRLGKNFELDSQLVYNCNDCGCLIKPTESKRYKCKTQPSVDICESCIKKNDRKMEDYYVFDNVIEEAVYHDWYTCDKCGQYPICGVRYSYLQNEDYDLCESCFDEDILTNHNPKYDRASFEAVEVPDQGAGFPVHHRVRCSACHVIPIIGERFKCNEATCRDINLCRNCFFKKKEMKDHKCDHTMDLIPEPSSHTAVHCFGCKAKGIEGPAFTCKTCAHFILCLDCFKKREILYPFDGCPSHKKFHEFSKLK